MYPATPVAAENIVTSLLGTPPTVSFCLCFLEFRDFSLWPTNTARITKYERINRRGKGCLGGWMVMEQGGTVVNRDRGGVV